MFTNKWWPISVGIILLIWLIVASTFQGFFSNSCWTYYYLYGGGCNDGYWIVAITFWALSSVTFVVWVVFLALWAKDFRRRRADARAENAAIAKDPEENYVDRGEPPVYASTNIPQQDEPVKPSYANINTGFGDKKIGKHWERCWYSCCGSNVPGVWSQHTCLWSLYPPTTNSYYHHAGLGL